MNRFKGLWLEVGILVILMSKERNNNIYVKRLVILLTNDK